MQTLSKTSKEIEIIEKAVDFLNKNLFDKKLSKIKITIQPDKNTRNLTYGWACPMVWKNEKEEVNELNITANSLKRPFKEIWITLVHELIHIYAFCNGDLSGATSRQGRYHGKKFKELCDKFYLITEPNETIGYITPHQKMLKEQKEIYQKFLKTIKIDLKPLFKYQRIIGIKSEKTKNKTIETLNDLYIRAIKEFQKMTKNQFEINKIETLETNCTSGIIENALFGVYYKNKQDQEKMESIKIFSKNLDN